MEDKDFLTWNIEISVHKEWVADGFNLEDSEDIIDMLQHRLPYAFKSELNGKIIKAPPKGKIKKLQRG